ncbi:MAG: hypothetical protein B1H11_12100 [Desulfobacteraceae bacterium 4484_190.1]|nr:MAG: hypothetical protein B1H11_12100 [Desulfobacteraceae bacterium 4484_190.1]
MNAHGQVYIVLSRCKTIEGMVLSFPISSRGVEIDEAIMCFDKNTHQNPPSESRLQAAKISYQL